MGKEDMDIILSKISQRHIVYDLSYMYILKKLASYKQLV